MSVKLLYWTCAALGHFRGCSICNGPIGQFVLRRAKLPPPPSPGA